MRTVTNREQITSVEPSGPIKAMMDMIPGSKAASSKRTCLFIFGQHLSFSMGPLVSATLASNLQNTESFFHHDEPADKDRSLAICASCMQLCNPCYVQFQSKVSGRDWRRFCSNMYKTTSRFYTMSTKDWCTDLRWP